EAILTMLYPRKTIWSHPYAVGGALHGIGLKAVNALSEWLIAEVRRDGFLRRQSFSRGVRASDVGKNRPPAESGWTGTAITFLPDAEIFSAEIVNSGLNYDVLLARCRQLACLLPEVTIHLSDRRGEAVPREATLRFDGGLEAFVADLNRERKALHAP